jgi:hypothetical protein
VTTLGGWSCVILEQESGKRGPGSCGALAPPPRYALRSGWSRAFQRRARTITLRRANTSNTHAAESITTPTKIPIAGSSRCPVAWGFHGMEGRGLVLARPLECQIVHRSRVHNSSMRGSRSLARRFRHPSCLASSSCAAHSCLGPARLRAWAQLPRVERAPAWVGGTDAVTATSTGRVPRACLYPPLFARGAGCPDGHATTARPCGLALPEAGSSVTATRAGAQWRRDRPRCAVPSEIHTPSRSSRAVRCESDIARRHEVERPLRPSRFVALSGQQSSLSVEGGWCSRRRRCPARRRRQLRAF